MPGRSRKDKRKGESKKAFDADDEGHSHGEPMDSTSDVTEKAGHGHPEEAQGRTSGSQMQRTEENGAENDQPVLFGGRKDAVSSRELQAAVDGSEELASATSGGKASAANEQPTTIWLDEDDAGKPIGALSVQAEQDDQDSDGGETRRRESKRRTRSQPKRKKSAVSDDDDESPKKKTRGTEDEGTGGQKCGHGSKAESDVGVAKPVVSSAATVPMDTKSGVATETKHSAAAASAQPLTVAPVPNVPSATTAVKTGKSAWNPADYMRLVVPATKPGYVPPVVSGGDNINAVIKRALEGDRKGLARNVEVVLVGDAPLEIVDYLNAFCAALNRSLSKQWYECGRYLRAGSINYYKCFEHPTAGQVMRMCLKNVQAKCKDGGVHAINMLYPELLHELIGAETYQRCDTGLASKNPEEQKAALEACRSALLSSSAFTTGFKCSVALGWKAGQAKEGNLQGIFLRPNDSQPQKVDPPSPEAYEVQYGANGNVVYAIPKKPASAMADG